MYSAAMTLGVNNGEERLNNLYCMGADAKINKAKRDTELNFMES